MVSPHELVKLGKGGYFRYGGKTYVLDEDPQAASDGVELVVHELGTKHTFGFMIKHEHLRNVQLGE